MPTRTDQLLEQVIIMLGQIAVNTAPADQPQNQRVSSQSLLVETPVVAPHSKKSFFQRFGLWKEE